MKAQNAQSFLGIVARLDTEKLAAKYEEDQVPKEGENLEPEDQSISEENQNVGGDNHNSQDYDQEGSILDEHFKNSIPDTLSLTIQDSRFVEATRVHLEACSHITDLTVDVPRNDRLPNQVAYGNGSAIRAEGQQDDNTNVREMLGQTLEVEKPQDRRGSDISLW